MLAGIIPGGFSWIRGKLLTLSVRAKKAGVFDFIFNPSSTVYANDEEATKQDIISQPLRLRVVAGKDNLENRIPDTTPPESFIPVLVNIPDGGKGSWAVSFTAQDKISGIASYEVAESLVKIDVRTDAGVRRLLWRPAQSPFILQDQELSSHIYVKAVDNRGNYRVEYLAPQTRASWYRTPGGYILILLCIFFALYALNKRLHWKFE